VPKLIVYVKADTWRRVVEKAGDDAAVLARAISVEAIEEFVAGLSERDLPEDGSANRASGELTPAPTLTSRTTHPTAQEPSSRPRSESPDDHFKPDFGNKIK
jgi:hypothetical protein